MNMLIVGAWSWPQYEDAFAKGLESCGISVSKLSTNHFFYGRLGRLQMTLPIPGRALLRLNRAIFSLAKSERPDAILFWRPTHVLPSTIVKLRHLGIQTISYNNDDPFGPQAHGNVPWHHHWLWFWYLKCLPYFTFNFFYRQVNCKEALICGAKHAEVLLPYFQPWQDQPLELSMEDLQLYATDIVFVGHYEPDSRVNSIRALIGAGLTVKVWSGRDWGRETLGDIYADLSPILPTYGDEYTKALCGAKVCLAFLSKMNRDTYTRRCFEIPACGRVMLAERTADLQRMFKEDEEACFFSSTEELVEKALWLIANPDIRENIAQAGLRRVWADGADVNSRAGYFLNRLASHTYVA